MVGSNHLGAVATTNFPLPQDTAYIEIQQLRWSNNNAMVILLAI
jgi:hypothetical protein